MKHTAIALLASTLLLPIVTTPVIAAGRATALDRAFIRQAALGGNDEIALSRIAEHRAPDSDVREFARTMVQQHSAAGARLAQIATDLGVRVPSQPDLEHRRIASQLMTEHGSSFDRTYINTMVKDHTAADHVFQMGATVDSDRLRNFAISTLPVVENHLKMATDLKQTMMDSKMSKM